MTHVDSPNGVGDSDDVKALHEVASAPSISPQVAADLDLDQVFSFLDKCRTGFGRAVLYHRLRRTDHSDRELAEFHQQVERFRLGPALTSRVEAYLRPISRRQGYRYWVLCRGDSLQLPFWIWIGNVAALATACAALAAVHNPAWLGLIMTMVLGNFVARYFLAPYLAFLTEPLRELGQVVTAVQHFLSDREMGRSSSVDRTLLSDLRGPSIRRWASWLGRDPLGHGDVAASLQEYLNQLLWLDVVASWQIARLLSGKHARLAKLGQWVGETDAALAVAECRAAAPSWTRPEFSETAGTITIVGAYHPLLSVPVANDLSLAPPGIVISGGNMSGKSTWLRTIGVNVLLAQTISTAFASSYNGPRVTIESSMVTSDSLCDGISHFEQAAVSVLQAFPKISNSWSLFLLDEPFSGTNDKDRTASTIAVLMYLERHFPQCMVLLTTHEPLVFDFGCPPYGAVHFRTEPGLVQDYRLRAGRTLRPNAIETLRLLKAPQALVELVCSYRQAIQIPECPSTAVKV